LDVEQCLRFEQKHLRDDEAPSALAAGLLESTLIF